MKFFFRTTLIPFILIPLLIGEPVWGQTTFALPSDEGSSGADLQLRVINAEGSRVLAGSRTTRGFTVQVTNATGAGVSDAAVAIRLPDSGSSGVFPDGSHSAVVYTDTAGNAHVDTIQWSETPGIAPIRVTATKGSDHAGVLIEQTLVPSGTPLAALQAGAISSTVPVPSAGPAVIPAVAAAEPSGIRQPGTLAAAPSISVTSIGHNSRSISANPLSNAALEPSISVVSSSQERFSSGTSMKKWIILGVVIAAGAGAGFAFMNKGSKSSSTAATSSSISFGSPTISIGQP